MPNTRRVANLPDKRMAASLEAHNDLVDLLVDAGVVVHHGVDDLITSPDATDLASSQVLAQELALWIPAHGANVDVHTTADVIAQAAAWSSAPAVPNDLAEVGAVLNELKADINTHVAQTDHHRGHAWGDIGGDGLTVARAITTSDFASTQGEANALANALKAFCNHHAKAAMPTVEVKPS